jgi:serine/threonine-protein kinase RIO1
LFSTKIESEEEEDESLQRRRKKKRQKDIVDDSFDPQTMQEIQSLVKVINL